MKRFLSIFYLFFFVSCQQPEIPIPEISYGHLTVKTTLIQKEEGDCENEDCASYKAQYPYFQSLENEEVATRLNQQIETMLITPLSSKTSLDEGILDFLGSHAETKNSRSGNSLYMYHHSIISISWFNGQILTLQIEHNFDTGGAHPNEKVLFETIDISDGHTVKPEAWFLPGKYDELKKLAEGKFRKMKLLTLDANLALSGYTFENNNFKLPQQMGFSESGLVLFYNHYEIAPYSHGETVIIFTPSELEGFLRF